MFEQVLVPQLFGASGETLMAIGQYLVGANGQATTILPSEIETVEVEASTLLVCESLPGRIDVDVLLPMGAKALKLTSDHCLLIPFGSGRSGVRAAQIGITLARTVDLSIVFYHTAWRKSEVDSQNGWDHLTIEAKQISETLLHMVSNARLDGRFRFVVETADSVVDGLIRTALIQKAALIVMARGDEVRMGSYVDQLAAVSPVPLLIARKED